MKESAQEILEEVSKEKIKVSTQNKKEKEFEEEEFLRFVKEEKKKDAGVSAYEVSQKLGISKEKAEKLLENLLENEKNKIFLKKLRKKELNLLLINIRKN